MIPEAAVEAAAVILAEAECASIDRDAGYGDGDNPTREDLKIFMPSAMENARIILEAALPHLLSHEREETRLAHLDAVVNAQTVGKLNSAIESVLALVRDNDMNGVVIVSADRVRAAIAKELQ